MKDGYGDYDISDKVCWIEIGNMKEEWICV